VDRSGYGNNFDKKTGLLPAGVLRRNFWFAPSTIRRRSAPDQRSALITSASRRTIPTAMAPGPTARFVFGRYYGDLPADEVAKIRHENAAALYRHPVPPQDSPHAAALRIWL
jgi:hypothetical protein